jgi:hypothetical protein
VKGHCVIVIAEGAVDGLIDSEKSIMYEKMGIRKEDMVKDESGNVKSIVRIKLVMIIYM